MNSRQLMLKGMFYTVVTLLVGGIVFGMKWISSTEQNA